MSFTKLAAAAAVAITALVAAPTAAHAAGNGRVWFHDGGDQFTPSMIWSFDSSTGTGWKRSYIPSPTGWPVQRQTTFSYAKSGSTYTLNIFPYGTTNSITELSYSSATDTLLVNNDGYTETWYGCANAGLPAYARAAC
ncbi:hypothetical protein [Actinoplanes sp. HUAS TT8]|uniref:hypothetical protein n=1 Tax=Actinoplanes sp. HUAS TT8 TaxID=3447453 RepID=UPI003F51CFA6